MRLDYDAEAGTEVEAVSETVSVGCCQAVVRESEALAAVGPVQFYVPSVSAVEIQVLVAVLTVRVFFG